MHRLIFNMMFLFLHFYSIKGTTTDSTINILSQEAHSKCQDKNQSIMGFD